MATPQLGAPWQSEALEIGKENKPKLRLNSFQSFLFYFFQETKDPIHIMNIGIRMEEEKDDSDLSEQFAIFCASKQNEFHEAGIRRITIVAFYNQQFPRYFTYRLVVFIFVTTLFMTLRRGMDRV